MTSLPDASRARPSRRGRPGRRCAVGPSASALTALAAVVALAGCSGTGSPESSSSSSSSGGSSIGSAAASETAGVPAPSGFELPDGVSLTEPGSELSFGESATVAVEPNRSRGSALSLVVDQVQQGRTADLSDFVLSDRARSATPYYVDVTVTNEGPGDLGGYAVPLYGQFDDSALVENTTFATPFESCPSTGLPRQFEPERSVERCLVFLVPDGGDLQGVAFARAGDDPIAWSGSIAAPAEDAEDAEDAESGGGNG